MKRKNNILNFLTTEEIEQFLDELLSASKGVQDIDVSNKIRDCIEGWEDIAELNSIPNFKEKVWERFNKLKAVGKLERISIVKKKIPFVKKSFY